MTKCEIRDGIGLCDDCALPKWPQKYIGYGIMICLDCAAAAQSSRNAILEPILSTRH